MSPVTDDRGVGPRAMAYRKWESVHFCIDCNFTTTNRAAARMHQGRRHRIKTRKRHRVLK